MMGVYHTYSVICPVCDFRSKVDLVNSVNVTRFPALKAKILNRTLNRVRCPRCGKFFIVEKPFFYSDFRHRRFIAVYPRKERHFHGRASKQAGKVFKAFSGMRLDDRAKSRVAFGLEELREKVIAADADVDDRMLELLKVYVIREHPFLIDKQRLRITLNDVDRERLEFYCTFDLERNYFKAYVPRAYLGTLRGTSPDRAATAPYHRAHSLATETFSSKEATPWVNLWKLNPATDALSLLSSFAIALRDGKPVDPDQADFDKMLRTLPSGSQLPNWAKRDLQTLAEFARKKKLPNVARRLFQIRFGIGFDSDWFKNSNREDERAIWTVLESLPDIAVEGNTWIKAIYLDTGEDGGGVYDPSEKEIHIGSHIEADENALRSVVLHEVGHAVHEKFDRRRKHRVTDWLTDKFGWRFFDPEHSVQIDQWIDLMGGYPAGTSLETKTQVRSLIQQSIGNEGSFEAAQIVEGPEGHLWNRRSFGPRKAFELTQSDWYKRCGKWHRHDGKSFFVNYNYSLLMAVDTDTVGLVLKSMPDTYAAMSHWEFFAELFAWYYDSRAPKRAAIPKHAATWLKTHVGPLDLSVSDPAPPARKRSVGNRRAGRR